jgi:hypothetical protein
VIDAAGNAEGTAALDCGLALVKMLSELVKVNPQRT